jgi:hypothetical protein
MINVDQVIALDGVRQFLKLHATCGGAFVDTAELPTGTGYRVLAACHCGDTVEYWLPEGVLPRHRFVDTITDAPTPLPLPRRRPARPRKVA